MPAPHPPAITRPLPPGGPSGGPPPPVGPGRLLALGLGTALRLVWAVPLQAAVLWLVRAVAWTPAVVAFGIARDAVERELDPLAAVARAATEPSVLLPTAGLALTLGLLAAAVQTALWAGLSGSLAGAVRNRGRPPPPRVFAAALAASFPRFLALGAAVATFAVAWFGAVFSLLLSAAKLYLDALDAGRGGAPAAAAAALGIALYLVGTPILDLVARLAAARLATGTGSALAAIHEACGQLLRRPFALGGGVLAIRLGAFLLAGILAAPASLLPPAPLPLLVARLAVEGAADLVLAFGLLAELAFLVAAAVDDREGLPGSQYSNPLPPMNSRRIEVGGTWSG